MTFQDRLIAVTAEARSSVTSEYSNIPPSMSCRRAPQLNIGYVHACFRTWKLGPAMANTRADAPCCGAVSGLSAASGSVLLASARGAPSTPGALNCRGLRPVFAEAR